jgi:multiple sugar transport system permease protein
MVASDNPGAARQAEIAVPATRPRGRTAVRRRWQAIGWHVLLICVAVPFVFPFFWLVTGTFKPSGDLLVVPPVWIPSHWTMSNVTSLFHYSDVNIPFYAENTLYICAFNVVASVASCSLIAYGFARINFPGRNILFGIVIATLILPNWATLVPTYMVFKWLGWLGTFNPLTIPALFGDAFTIFLLRQFMLTIPHELSEAAYIDGASEFGIYWRIILPLVKPALAVAALFVFINNYNDFFGPLIYLSDSGKYTLALGAFQFIKSRGVPDIGAIVAFTTLVTLPLIVIFFFTQRRLVQGITLTGIKG